MEKIKRIGKLYYKENTYTNYIEVVEYNNEKFVLIGNEYVPLKILNLQFFNFYEDIK